MSGSSLSNVFDGYTRRARLAPAFIAALPVSMICIAVIPNFANWHKLWLLALSSGAIGLIGQMVREKGRKVQPQLWQSWGGPPTTQALRHRSATNSRLLARRHQQLALLLGEEMPSRRQEAGNPNKADQVYEMAVRYLISRTRDTTAFRLIFLENCQYGFRRNMLGMRRVGLFLSTSACIATLGFAVESLHGLPIWRTGFTLVAAASLILTLVWWRVVNPDWVQAAARNYAERLLDSLDVLLPIETQQAQSGDSQT